MLYLIKDMLDLLSIQRGRLEINDKLDLNPMQACEEVLSYFREGIEAKNLNARITEIKFNP